jgi:hypothetical protein
VNALNGGAIDVLAETDTVAIGTSRQFGLAAPMSASGVIADITQTDPHGAASDQKDYCCQSPVLVPIKGFIGTKAFGMKYSIMTL